MSAGEVSDAAVEAAVKLWIAMSGWDYDEPAEGEEADRQWMRQTMRGFLTAAIPHLSPRPDAEVVIAALNAVKIPTTSHSEQHDMRAYDYWRGYRAARDECVEVLRATLATPAPAPVTPTAGEDGAAWFDHDEPLPAPAPVDDREPLAAQILIDAAEAYGHYAQADGAEAINWLRRRAAGYVKGGQA